MASNLLSATKPHSANEGKCKNKRNLVTWIVFICKSKKRGPILKKQLLFFCKRIYEI